MRQLLQIGAGNIGRGYMAQLFHEAGYRLVFADALEPVVQALNRAGGYTLRVLDAHARSAREIRVEPVRAVSIADETALGREVRDASVIATAVGVNNLPRLAEPLARALAWRREAGLPGVDIYLCENTLEAGRELRDAVCAIAEAEGTLGNIGLAPWIRENVGFVGTTVARMVPIIPEEERRRDPLLVVADAYRPLPYDARACRHAPPEVPDFSPRENFPAEVERKLFLYNMCHGSLAYLGAPRGYRYVHETLQDGELREIFLGAAREVARALEREYPRDITREGNDAIIEDILVRYGNPLLQDTVSRVGRDPLRKLGRRDRLVGATLLCERHGIEPRNIERIIVQALAYRDPEDPAAVRLEEMIRTLPPEAVLREVCGLEAEEPPARRLLAHQEWQ
ncbi:MAG: hypothetical protein EA427_04635 [Spirochaetaceae bacterium]|nr:MAG: hypothetical protein EA427_04635 [Spirochaetaceae bacterium]